MTVGRGFSPIMRLRSALHNPNLLFRQPVQLVYQLINRRIRHLDLPGEQRLLVIECGVLQFPRRNRTISSQSSLRHAGQKTAIVQPAKNSDEFFSKSISDHLVRYGLQHLRDERDHAVTFTPSALGIF